MGGWSNNTGGRKSNIALRCPNCEASFEDSYHRRDHYRQFARKQYWDAEEQRWCPSAQFERFFCSKKVAARINAAIRELAPEKPKSELAGGFTKYIHGSKRVMEEIVEASKPETILSSQVAKALSQVEEVHREKDLLEQIQEGTDAILAQAEMQREVAKITGSKVQEGAKRLAPTTGITHDAFMDAYIAQLEQIPDVEPDTEVGEPEVTTSVTMEKALPVVQSVAPKVERIAQPTMQTEEVMQPKKNGAATIIASYVDTGLLFGSWTPSNVWDIDGPATTQPPKPMEVKAPSPARALVAAQPQIAEAFAQGAKKVVLNNFKFGSLNAEFYNPLGEGHTIMESKWVPDLSPPPRPTLKDVLQTRFVSKTETILVSPRKVLCAKSKRPLRSGEIKQIVLATSDPQHPLFQVPVTKLVEIHHPVYKNVITEGSETFIMRGDLRLLNRKQQQKFYALRRAGEAVVEESSISYWLHKERFVEQLVPRKCFTKYLKVKYEQPELVEFSTKQEKTSYEKVSKARLRKMSTAQRLSLLDEEFGPDVRGQCWRYVLTDSLNFGTLSNRRYRKGIHTFSHNKSSFMPLKTFCELIKKEIIKNPTLADLIVPQPFCYREGNRLVFHVGYSKFTKSYVKLQTLTCFPTKSGNAKVPLQVLQNAVIGAEPEQEPDIISSTGWEIHQSGNDIDQTGSATPKNGLIQTQSGNSVQLSRSQLLSILQRQRELLAEASNGAGRNSDKQTNSEIPDELCYLLDNNMLLNELNGKSNPNGKNKCSNLGKRQAKSWLKFWNSKWMPIVKPLLGMSSLEVVHQVQQRAEGTWLDLGFSNKIFQMTSLVAIRSLQTYFAAQMCKGIWTFTKTEFLGEIQKHVNAVQDTATKEMREIKTWYAGIPASIKILVIGAIFMGSVSLVRKLFKVKVHSDATMNGDCTFNEMVRISVQQRQALPTTQTSKQVKLFMTAAGMIATISMFCDVKTARYIKEWMDLWWYAVTSATQMGSLSDMIFSPTEYIKSVINPLNQESTTLNQRFLELIRQAEQKETQDSTDNPLSQGFQEKRQALGGEDPLSEVQGYVIHEILDQVNEAPFSYVGAMKALPELEVTGGSMFQIARNVAEGTLPQKHYLLNAPTGSGKSTIFPTYIGAKTNKRILILVPLVAAVLGVYQRLRESLHNRVGYHADKTSTNTNAQYIVSTYGHIAHQLMQGIEPYEKYGIILADECHVSTLETVVVITDLLAKKQQRQQTTIFMTATPFKHLTLESVLTEKHVQQIRTSKFSDVNTFLRYMKEGGEQRILQTAEDGCILFCATHKETMQLAAELHSPAHPAIAYHSQLRSPLGEFVEKYKEQLGKIPYFICTTNALESGVTFPARTCIDFSTKMIAQVEGDRQSVSMARQSITMPEQIQRRGRVARVMDGVFFYCRSGEQNTVKLDPDSSVKYLLNCWINKTVCCKEVCDLPDESLIRITRAMVPMMWCHDIPPMVLATLMDHLGAIYQNALEFCGAFQSVLGQMPCTTTMLSQIQVAKFTSMSVTAHAVDEVKDLKVPQSHYWFNAPRQIALWENLLKSSELEITPAQCSERKNNMLARLEAQVAHNATSTDLDLASLLIKFYENIKVYRQQISALQSFTANTLEKVSFLSAIPMLSFANRNIQARSDKRMKELQDDIDDTQSCINFLEARLKGETSTSMSIEKAEQDKIKEYLACLMDLGYARGSYQSAFFIRDTTWKKFLHLVEKDKNGIYREKSYFKRIVETAQSHPWISLSIASAGLAVCCYALYSCLPKTDQGLKCLDEKETNSSNILQSKDLQYEPEGKGKLREHRQKALRVEKVRANARDDRDTRYYDPYSQRGISRGIKRAYRQFYNVDDADVKEIILHNAKHEPVLIISSLDALNAEMNRMKYSDPQLYALYEEVKEKLQDAETTIDDFTAAFISGSTLKNTDRWADIEDDKFTEMVNSLDMLVKRSSEEAFIPVTVKTYDGRTIQATVANYRGKWQETSWPKVEHSDLKRKLDDALKILPEGFITKLKNECSSEQIHEIDELVKCRLHEQAKLNNREAVMPGTFCNTDTCDWTPRVGIIHRKDGNGNFTQVFLQCIALYNVCIYPFHGWLKEGEELQFHFPTGTFTGKMQRCAEFTNRDIAYTNIPKRIKGVSGGVVLAKPNEKKNVFHFSRIVAQKVKTEAVYQGYSTTAHLDGNCWAHTIPTQVGSCGGPMLNENGHLVGYHVGTAGDYSYNDFMGFSDDLIKAIRKIDVSLTSHRQGLMEWRETEFYKTVNYLPPNLNNQDPIREEWRAPAHKDVKRCTNPDWMASKLLEGPTFELLGKMTRMVDYNTKISRNQDFTLWLAQKEVRDELSRMNKQRTNQGKEELCISHTISAQNRDAAILDTNKYNRISTFAWSEDLLKRSTQMVIDLLEPYIQKCTRQPLELVYQDMEWSTACGARYDGLKSEFRARVIGENNMMAYGEQCWERFDVPTSRYVPTIWTNSLKDELRPIEKVKANKTRTFTAAPIEFVVGSKQALDQFNHQFMEHHLTLPHTVGINQWSGGWHRLYQKLKGKNFLYSSGDGSRFDSSPPSEFFDAIYTIRCHFAHPDMWQVLSNIYTEICFTPIVLHDGNIVKKDHGNNSGQCSTVIDNSLIMLLLCCASYLEHTPASWHSVKQMNDHWHFTVNGDDYIGGMSPRLAKLLTKEKMAKTFNDFQFIYEWTDYSTSLFDQEYMSLSFISILDKQSCPTSGELIAPLRSGSRQMSTLAHTTSFEPWIKLQVALTERIKAWVDKDLFDFITNYAKWYMHQIGDSCQRKEWQEVQALWWDEQQIFNHYFSREAFLDTESVEMFNSMREGMDVIFPPPQPYNPQDWVYDQMESEPSVGVTLENGNILEICFCQDIICQKEHNFKRELINQIDLMKFCTRKYIALFEDFDGISTPSCLYPQQQVYLETLFWTLKGFNHHDVANKLTLASDGRFKRVSKWFHRNLIGSLVMTYRDNQHLVCLKDLARLIGNNSQVFSSTEAMSITCATGRDLFNAYTTIFDGVEQNQLAGIWTKLKPEEQKSWSEALFALPKNEDGMYVFHADELMPYLRAQPNLPHPIQILGAVEAQNKARANPPAKTGGAQPTHLTTGGTTGTGADTTVDPAQDHGHAGHGQHGAQILGHRRDRLTARFGNLLSAPQPQGYKQDVMGEHEANLVRNRWARRCGLLNGNQLRDHPAFWRYIFTYVCNNGTSTSGNLGQEFHINNNIIRVSMLVEDADQHGGWRRYWRLHANDLHDFLSLLKEAGEEMPNEWAKKNGFPPEYSQLGFDVVDYCENLNTHEKAILAAIKARAVPRNRGTLVGVSLKPNTGNAEETYGTVDRDIIRDLGGHSG